MGGYGAGDAGGVARGGGLNAESRRTLAVERGGGLNAEDAEKTRRTRLKVEAIGPVVEDEALRARPVVGGSGGRLLTAGAKRYTTGPEV